MRTLLLPAALLLPLRAQAPLAGPLAEFDRLISQLHSGSVVGEPVRAGNVTVIPYAAIQFGLGSAGAPIASGGGMGGRVVPLGVLIVDGDDVRAEQIPEQDGKPSLVREVLQAVLDRKVVVMGNGLNIGNAPGSVQDLAPMISGMMGQTTIIGNALNLGKLAAPSAAASAAAPASLADLEKLFAAQRYADALALTNALLAKDPKNTGLQVWKARILEHMNSR